MEAVAVRTKHGDIIRRQGELRFTHDTHDVVGTRSIILKMSDLPIARSRSRIRNICGFVDTNMALAPVMDDRHPAWNRACTTLGRCHESYTLKAGTVTYLGKRVIFKGATSFGGVQRTLGQLLLRHYFDCDDDDVLPLRAYLVVATVCLGRNVYTHDGCMLEVALAAEYGREVRVRRRTEDSSNAVMFNVLMWDRFCSHFGHHAVPSVGTISVSRRGVVNVRLAWHSGARWAEGAEAAWLTSVEIIRNWLLQIV